MKFIDKYEKPLFIALTLFTLTILFVISFIPVHAASPSSLPYIVSENVPSELSFSFSDVVDGAFSNYGSWFSGQGISKDDVLNCPNYILVYTERYGSTGFIYTYHIILDSSAFSVSLSNSDYDSFVVGTNTVDIRMMGYGSDYGKYITLDVLVNAESGNWQNAGLGYNNNANLHVFYGPYPVYYPYAIKDTFYYGSDNLPVLTNFSEPFDSSGHSSPPVDDSGHFIDDGNGNRIPKPNKPSPPIYTPPTIQFPTVDTSTLETLIESLIDLVQYFISYIGGVINGWFSNLLSNLDIWFDYVVQSFNYAANNIVGAIKDLAQTFYNNMVSLFEPFYEFLSGVASFFNHLIEIGTIDGAFNFANIVSYLFLPDASAIYPIFVSHDEFNIIGISNHLFNEYRLMMTRVENINTLHYILIPSFTFHGQTVPQTRIDFSWFDNYKVYSDGIISAFLIIGYVYYLFTRISGWLRGNQGDVYVGDNSSNYRGTKIGF